MSTQEIANRLVELCRKGDYETCYKELYSPNAKSIEPNKSFGPPVVEGMEAIHKKGEMFNNMVEEMHGGTVGDPIVAGNYFSLVMSMDVTFKGQPRKNDSELCMYKVEDGKIVSEQFFY